MRLILLVSIAILSLTGCSHTYYIVRHAEKAQPGDVITMSTPGNPPLSAAGEVRAQVLKKTLKEEKIAYIFSTNTIRTLSTAEPLSKEINVKPEVYGNKPDTAFINRLKRLKKNVLIVGHSNTVDDIVNGLTGKTTVAADLHDSEYDNLFVVKYKGKKIKYERRKYGNISK